jgi:hypothetical protein
MEKIVGTTHNTQPFQATAIYGKIYDFDFSYTKSTNDEEKAKDTTYFEKVFLGIPTFDFEDSTISTFINAKEYKSLLQLNKDFILYAGDGSNELKSSGTKLIQTVEVKEYGFKSLNKLNT